jgi:putative ABC transport system permease protein
VFKNTTEKKGSLFSLRKALVVFQFALSIILIIATIIALQQLQYMQSQNLGFEKEQVVAIPLRDQSETDLQNLLKSEFVKIQGITTASASSSTPGRRLSNIVVLPEGVQQDQLQTMNTLIVDYDFINTYKLNLVAGRGFSKDFGSDSSAFVLNETAVRELGWGNPEKAIGKKFDWGLGKQGVITGVVKDFHFKALNEKIIPLVMHILPVTSGWYGFISVRVNTQDMQEAIQSLKVAWIKLMPGHPFDYFFVDEDYNKQYQGEQQLSSLSLIFSVLVIFISCLGLFGLVMVSVSQRIKEIGVRKVLGASVTGIASLLSKDFLRLVGIAILIASPIAWWLMNKWLEAFAYRIHIGWWVFPIAGIAALLIALLTVSFQAIRAALANPVKSLRTE